MTSILISLVAIVEQRSASMSIYDGRIPDEQLYDTRIYLIGKDFLWVHKCSQCHPGIRALMATVSPCFEVPW